MWATDGSDTEHDRNTGEVHVTPLRDALERELRLPAPARRVVSLVPSESESVVALAGLGALVGRTEYCEEPAGLIEPVPTVGGTKNVDVEAVVRLAPDLVLANMEENTRSQVEALIAAGLPVHVSFPCTVDDSLLYLDSLCALLGIDPAAAGPVREARAAVAGASDAVPERRLTVFVPIWLDPWMTFDRHAFASDLLMRIGADNVFGDRPRRYPLAADLAPQDASERRDPPAVAEDRDTRYPRIRLDEVVERAPELVLLPDEPYRFTEADAERLRALAIPAARAGTIFLCSGKDLFWYGTRLAGAMERLRALMERARPRHPVHT